MMSMLDRKKDLKILNWLSKLNSQAKQTRVLKDHQEGTGDFLLKSHKFMNWLDGKYRILWCIGPRKYKWLVSFSTLTLNYHANLL